MPKSGEHAVSLATTECAMQISTTTLTPSLTKITLVGQMNAAGAQKIDLSFNVTVGASQNVLVDMTEVDFLASMGIRTLVVGAKALNRRGGRMVIMKPTPDVEQVLIASGIDSLISIVHAQDEALALLAPTQP
jgi:anti-anti-sigma factor